MTDIGQELGHRVQEQRVPICNSTNAQETLLCNLSPTACVHVHSSSTHDLGVEQSADVPAQQPFLSWTWTRDPAHPI